ncbi:MAG: hypothetical protein PHV20_07330 [Bacteroidales bacterium]|nr:hypothetical protein [Bacteroidales bacterium]
MQKFTQSRLLIFFFLSGLLFHLNAQQSMLDVGVRLQKTVNLYVENGFSVQYSHPHFLSDKLYVGASFVTSRLGTAYHSNAIPQDNYIVSASWLFRKNHLLRPFARLNSGYFSADYGDPIFDDLSQKSLLLSPEFGVTIQPHIPLKMSFSFGYNLIAGDGLSGPGTLFPLYLQTTISWNVFKN